MLLLSHMCQKCIAIGEVAYEPVFRWLLSAFVFGLFGVSISAM